MPGPIKSTFSHFYFSAKCNNNTTGEYKTTITINPSILTKWPCIIISYGEVLQSFALTDRATVMKNYSVKEILTVLIMLVPQTQLGQLLQFSLEAFLCETASF